MEAFDKATRSPQAEAKAALLEVLADDSVAAAVLRPEGRAVRGRVDEAILRLERLQVAEEPAYSYLLDGNWTVKYVGSYSPGLLNAPTRDLELFLFGGVALGNALNSFANGFWGQAMGLELTNKTVRVSDKGKQVEAFADVTVAGIKGSLSYTAERSPLSGQRLHERVTELRMPEPLGAQKTPVELRRTLLVTYLDKEVMVVRDASGLPEVHVREPAATRKGKAPF